MCYIIPFRKGSYAPRYVLLQGNIGTFFGKTGNMDLGNIRMTP